MRASRRKRYLPWAIVAVALLAIGGGLLFGRSPSDGDPPSYSSDRPDYDPRSKGRHLSRQERQAKRFEKRLAQRPADPELQLATTEAWLEAGLARLYGRDTSVETIPPLVREDLETGLRVWDSYLRQTGGTAGADIAERVGEASFLLAEIGSCDPADLEVDVARAARALRIAGRQRPILYTLSNTATYAYFNGEFARGDAAAKAAAAGFKKASRRKIVLDQLDFYRGNAEVFRRLLREANVELSESGEALLDVPLKAYSGQAGINKDDPTS
jgi:hypothetical protein